MKLIRISENDYILDAGKDIRPEQVEAIRLKWKEWRERGDPFEIAMANGIDYEDRREPDIESRLRAIEERLHEIEEKTGIWR